MLNVTWVFSILKGWGSKKIRKERCIGSVYQLRKDWQKLNIN